MTPDQLSPVARSCWCYALVNSCLPHIRLQSEESGDDLAHWYKLLSKLQAFLTGELQSESNLQRFYEAFCDWRDTQTAGDSLNQRITALCLAATDAAVVLLSDNDCDDARLLPESMRDLYAELADLGGPAAELESYWNELSEEWTEALSAVRQRPVSKSAMRQICDVGVSPFGLED